MKTGIPALIAFLTLTACSMPFSERRPHEQVYRLSLSDFSQSPATRPQYSSLRISVVDVGVGLRTDRIMAWNAYELMPVVGIRWAENTDKLIEKTLSHALSQRGIFKYVTADPLGRTAELVLELNVQEFYLMVTDDKPTHVRVSFLAQLKSAASRDIIASDNFRSAISLESQDTNDVVKAFSQAMEQTTGEVLQRLFPQDKSLAIR